MARKHMQYSSTGGLCLNEAVKRLLLTAQQSARYVYSHPV